MKRDFDLIRSILLQVEACNGGKLIRSLDVDEAIPNTTLAEHIVLLIEAGLIDGKVLDYDAPAFIIQRMTWAGHDFLDAMRDDTIWRKAKDTILKPVGGVALDVLKQWLITEAKTKLGLPA
jgi:hypothetical protein